VSSMQRKQLRADGATSTGSIQEATRAPTEAYALWIRDRRAY